MDGYQIGLTMSVIEYFASRNEREEAESFIEYEYSKFDIDRGMYGLLKDYLEIAFKNKGDK